MLTQIINGHILTPQGWMKDGSVLISDGKILEVTNSDLAVIGAKVVDAKGMSIVPGFVAMNIHGGGGFDFSECTEEAFHGAVAAHQKHGATTIFPTVLAPEIGVIDKAVTVCEEMMRKKDGPILGLHIEGPYLNPKMAASLFIDKENPADPKEYKEILERTDCIKRWDSSPEIPGALEFAQYLKSRGILSAISHTEAEFDDIKTAYNAGFTHAAHFYNAMPGFHKRREYKYELDMDVEDVLAALDEEESSRIELQDGYTLILVDIPSIEIRHEKESYTTIPLGILITSGEIVTVCTEDTPVLQAFLNNRVREFSTKKKLRFVYQILYRIAVLYQSDLRIIDKMRTEIEERVGDDTEEVDLIALHELESTLVYFATSLRANGVVLDRLTRYKRLEQYPEDKELLGDVIVENQQAIEMTSIYRDIINGTRELLSSVIDNRMNSIMKSLTVITLVMAIPTVISGIYGMNVNEHWVPFANTAHGFAIIIGIMVIICVIILLLLRKKRIL